MDFVTQKTETSGVHVSERIYEELYSKAGILYFLLDSDGRIVSCNILSQERLGYEKKELSGKDFIILFPEEERENIKKVLSTCLNRGYVKDVEASICGKKDRSFKVRLSGLTTNDDTGHPSEVRFYLQDISELIMVKRQKEISLRIVKFIQEKGISEEAVMETLCAIQELMESDGVGISIQRSNGEKLIQWKWKDLENESGVSKENFQKWSPDTWTQIHQSCSGAEACYFTSGRSFWTDSLSDLILEVQPEYKRDYLVSLAEYESLVMIPILNKETTLGYLVMAHRQAAKWMKEDVTFLEEIARVFSYEEKERAPVSLFPDGRSSSVMNVPILGIFSVKNGVIQFVNPWVEEFLGFTKEELQGKPFLDIVVPEFREAILDLSKGNVLDERPQRSCEVVVFTKNKDSRWVECAFTLLSVNGNSEELWYLINKEDQHRLQEHLLQARKMESLGMLAGGIVHEFKNLLAGIQGYSSLLCEDIPQESPFHSDVQQITRIAQKATEVACRLSAYAHGEIYVVNDLDVNQLIKEVAGILSRNVDNNIVLRAELDPKLMPIKTDASQIQQIILQVALNARDAMPSGGKIIFRTRNISVDKNKSLLISGGKPGPYVQITISDTGLGISNEVKKRIFEPYFTTKSQTAGKGLGLSMVKEIVEKHGGFISVFSEKEKGTVFKIHLPAGKRKIQKSEISSDEKLPLGKETILLVDDEKVFRETARKMLTRYGYKVMSVESSSEAIATYKKYMNRIDLIVLDLTLPGMEINKVLTWFKKLNPNVKIIVTSGLGDKNILEQTSQQRVAGFIQKPFQVRPFLSKVRAILNA